jgi:hypothetical protein
MLGSGRVYLLYLFVFLDVFLYFFLFFILIHIIFAIKKNVKTMVCSLVSVCVQFVIVAKNSFMLHASLAHVIIYEFLLASHKSIKMESYFNSKITHMKDYLYLILNLLFLKLNWMNNFIFIFINKRACRPMNDQLLYSWKWG